MKKMKTIKIKKTMATAAIFFWACAFSPLLAETTVSSRFSLNLQEWLVLEIGQRALSGAGAGNQDLTMETEITTGQSIQVKALLSAGIHKTIVLKGTVYSREDNYSEVLQWIGEGDLSGSGFIKTGQETVLAVWRGQGLKSGKLMFFNPEGENGKAYRAVFVLSSL